MLTSSTTFGMGWMYEYQPTYYLRYQTHHHLTIITIC